MAMQKAHENQDWENFPSIKTPLNEQNLNKLDRSVDTLDDRIIVHENVKATKEEVAPLLSNITFDSQTGIFTMTRKNGSTFTIDTLLEKIQTNWDYNPQTEQLILTMEDGTKQYIDLSELITEFEFLDTDTIDFSVDTSGKVSAIVKEGSIQEKHLRPDYLADIRVEAARAEAARDAARVSESNAKDSEDAAAASATASAASASQSANSASASAQSAQSASASASTATTQATNASRSAAAAATSETNAGNSATAARTSETNAGNSATSARNSATTATTQATNAQKSADDADKYATESESWAHGGTNSRAGENSDNSQYYYTKSKQIYDDLIAAGQVTGVKGNAETNFRHGNVNLTPANIGALGVNDKAVSATTADKVAHALTFTGGVSTTYDGSVARSVAIPSVINNLISTDTASALSAAQGKALQDGKLGKTEKASTAGTADKVAHALTFTGGASGSYDGSSAKSVAIPTSLPANGGTADTISTTLPISKGGTGATTANGAANNILIGTDPGTNPLNGWSLTDVDRMVFEGSSGGAVNSKFYRTPMTKVFDYLNAKTFNNAKNADTVDGKHASDLQNYSNLTNKPTIPAAYTLPLATSSVRGGVKIGYSENGKNYAVKLSNEQMYVTVPWTDNNTDVNVTQTNTATSADYRVLFSFTADDATNKGGARKSEKLKFNPSTGNLTATKVTAQTGDSTVTFISNDAADTNVSTTTGWTTVSPITSGDTHKNLFQKISQMFKNVRYLYKKLGTTDISSIGGGTVTGAISALNSGTVEVCHFYRLTSANLNDAPIDGMYRIGTGVINNEGYCSIMISWIEIQFRVSSTHISARLKYGNNAWTTWKEIY